MAWTSVVAILLAGCLAGGAAKGAEGADTVYTWKDVAIGTPATPGSHTWAPDTSTMKLSGGGAGLNLKGSDECHFVSTPHPAGDFEVIARLTELGGSDDATVGIMARSDNTPGGPMVALFLKAKDNSVHWISRSPGATTKVAPKVATAGIPLAKPGPLWLRMVRMDRNFAVYKSRDGKLWSMISNVSGGEFPLNGAFQLGFFACGASGAAEGKAVTATFDSIKIGPAQMRYKTSWVGNTFGCRPEDNHVSNTLSAMWVAADGTCYTSSYWDEAGQPVTSYRDGKVLRGLPIGTPQTGQGGITGDGKHLYVATVNHITELDPAAPDFAPQPIFLSINLLDKKTNNSVISGMASNGRELFVADSRDNIIRVVTLEPVKTYQTAEGANDGVALAPEPVIVPRDDKQLAPAVVYQTQRIGEGVKYTLPGLTAGGEYTIRCHLAEYIKRPEKADPRNRIISIDGTKVDVAEAAGGVLKPLVKDFPGYKADDKGNVTFRFGTYGGPGLCGLEVLNAKGERVLAINCGGPATGDFTGESQELISRSFAFQRPGVMTFDRRGDLWIIQRADKDTEKDKDKPAATPAPATAPATAPAALPSIKCYKTDGTFTGRAITDVVNPTCLAYDAAHDQLLVGEDLPNLNVRFYASLATKPHLARTFGEQGGVYAGPQPGLIHYLSPTQLVSDAGGRGSGYARFPGINGVGVDAKGNLYVGGGFQGTDLRMFTPDGQFKWMLNSLMFCDTYDVDPAGDGAEIYGTYNHLKLDLSKTEPGKEQTYIGYNWDWRNFGEPVRAGSSQSIVRRLGTGTDKRLVMFTSGQGTVGDINIYRYDGEIAIPAGGTRAGGKSLWIDANGDGKESPDELTKMDSPIGWVTTLCVDSKGDLWAGVPSTGGSFMRHFPFKGINDKGVPLYGGAKGEGYQDFRFPEEGDKTSGWGMSCRMDYDADRDIMIAFYPAVARTGDKDTSPAQYFMARYDDWSKGNRTPKWKVKALEPATDGDYFMYERNLFPYRGYMGMQIAGDYLFFAYLFGEVHVFDLNTGSLAEILSMGPEVAGSSAWEDAAMGLRAFKRTNGEYLVFTENSGWGGKNNFFRWKP
ncbi:MAG TPA: hypothetical protein VIL86_03885 [Tepidisphaeraceae bacterium]|jgi:hypothetical protein